MLPVKNLCSGCGACAAACPKNCIEMTADGEGFRYPLIQQEKCISCQSCERVCPVISPPLLSRETTAVAAQSMDEAVRAKSSSGGVFSALAGYVLAKGGLVCAAVYDESLRVRHIIIDKPDGLRSMRGAKYAQSMAESCFAGIKEALGEGRYVLFVGTPCQTAGLQRYLGAEHERLLLADMVCHGVPSPAVWEKYLMERRASDAPDSGIKSIDLRSKESGWSRYGYSVKIQYQNGTEYSVPQSRDAFMRGFVNDLYLRPSCSRCSFRGVERCSDLTLGDCWGIWDIAPEFDDDKGTSLVLLHSEKGRRVWDDISSGCRTCPLSVSRAAEYNPSMVSDPAPHPKREQLFSALQDGRAMIAAIEGCLSAQVRKGFLQRLKERIGGR